MARKRHALARISGRLAGAGGAHVRWIRRGLGGTQAKLVALYLCFLGVLAGVAVGYLLAPPEDRLYVKVPRHPPPVTPAPAGTRWVEVKTTGYCPCAICCGKHSDGHTAWKNRKVSVYPHGIAAERRLVPYGTRLFVPGYGEYTVDDTGGAMRQSAKRGIVHLDLRFKEHQQARQWGVQWHWIAMDETLPAAQDREVWLAQLRAR